ncbi:MAG: ABC transporter ATP-binding protein, partial [Alphaproteobacteria bacterium]
MNTNIISINKLCKKYQGLHKEKVFVALDSIDLDILQGSFFGLLGANGAGKSTLINILSGITNKTSGSCIINGYNLDFEQNQVKLSLGVVPQEIVFDPFFTARQILENHAGYFGIAKGQRKTDEILHALSLENKADLPSRSLSGGMKRRLLIAKALVHSPKILILDEPTAGVDIELREQLWQYVIKLNKAGTTILLTTHYIEEAEKMCSHIAVINRGTIIANDVKEKLLLLFDDKILTIKLNKAADKILDAIYLNKLNAKIEVDKVIIKYGKHHHINDVICHIVERK